jgi:hypothetical protein
MVVPKGIGGQERMSKKKKTPPPSRPDSPIQYRPGHLLFDQIAVTAKKLGLSRSECARRLAALAVNQLDIRHYETVCQMAAKGLGPADFFDACDRIRSGLESVESVLKSAGKPLLDETQRQEEIMRIAGRHVAVRPPDYERPGRQLLNLQYFDDEPEEQ